MPTILRENGFRFFFYSHEGNEPAHIHIIGRGGEMKVWLYSLTIAYAYNLTATDQRDALKITKENVILLRAKWKEWHAPANS